LNVGPYCRVIGSAIGCAGRAGGCPAVGAGIISSAGVQIVTAAIIKIPSPDDHLATSPDCRVRAPRTWRVSSAGGCPGIPGGIIRAAGVQIAAGAVVSAPDNHFATRPDCRMILSAIRRADGASSCPTVGNRIVSPAHLWRNWGWGWSARWSWAWGRTWAWVRGWGWRWGWTYSAPDNHLTASPYCCVILSGSGRVCCAGGCPTAHAGIVSPAGV
jgi:hypothetical protein